MGDGEIGEAMKFYIDMDGVLSDFDAAACAVLNTDNMYKWEFQHGTAAFWKAIDAVPNFWIDMPIMPDAAELLWPIRYMDVCILTALPHSKRHDVRDDKRAWAARHFPNLDIITCVTAEKPNHCKPGDVLVDDRCLQAEKWEANGGIFIHHTSAANSVHLMRAHGVI